jgi:hypothetical protein
MKEGYKMSVVSICDICGNKLPSYVCHKKGDITKLYIVKVENIFETCGLDYCESSIDICPDCSETVYNILKNSVLHKVVD